MSTTSPLASAGQVASIVVLGLLTGSMFGIWRGYDPAAWSATTFLQVHQGAVRGLNTLLPAMGAVVLALAAVLAIRTRHRRRVLAGYVAVIVLLAVAGIVTRTLNQPINELVMGWTPNNMPPDWMALRDRWWMWHLVRLAASGLAQLLLILTVLADRGTH